MKILIGYDGSESSNSLSADLKRAGLPPQVEATIVTVADVWLPPAMTAHDEGIVDEAEKARMRAAKALAEAAGLAEAASTHIGASFPQWKVTAEAYAGSPA